MESETSPAKPSEYILGMSSEYGLAMLSAHSVAIDMGKDLGCVQYMPWNDIEATYSIAR